MTETSTANPETNDFSIRRMVSEHPAIVLTAAYLFLTCIGIEHSWLVYREFALNYFDFASTDDFIVSAFK
jgi:hypothetical protein